MTTMLLTAVLTSAVAAPVPPEPPLKPPQGPPPAQVLASLTAEGDFEITRPVPVATTERRVRTVTIDGRPVREEYTVTVPRTVNETRRIKSEGVKVYTAGGKEVDAKDVPDKLKKPTIVLFANDGNKVDPFYLKIVKPDTLVVVAPAPAPQPLPAPALLPKKD
jgi:hypothetical protein